MAINISKNTFADHNLGFENIGLLSNSSINLADLVLFFGPPNTGKSYALKSIYSALMPLDEIMFQSVTDSYSYKNKGGYSFIFQRYKDHSNSILRFFEFIFRCHEQQIPLLLSLKDSKKIKEILQKLLLPIKIDMNKGSITLRLDEIGSFTLDRKDIYESIFQHVSNKFKSFIPFGQDSKIELDNTDVFNWYKKPITYNLTSTMSFELPHSIQDRISSTRKRRRFLYLPPLTLNIHSGYKQGSNPEGPVNIEYLELEYPVSQNNAFLYFPPNLDDENNSKLDLLEEIVDSMSRFRITTNKQKIAESEFRIIIGMIIQNIFTNTGHSSLLSVKKVLQDYIGTQELRFIPVGRTNFINLLEYVFGNPIERTENINIALERIQGGLYLSYLTWVGRGKELLYKNMQGQTIFYPVLQGSLTVDKSSKGLIYNTWNNFHLPLSLSSALASEVAGIILPYLTFSESGILLIEEPEAQMHPTAQFLTGLLLIALTKGGNTKIVVTTHSDLLLTAIAMIINRKPSVKEIMKIIKKLLPSDIKTDSDSIKTFASEVSKNANEITVKPYFFNGKGIDHKNISLLGSDIPSISEAIDNIVDWGYNISLE